MIKLDFQPMLKCFREEFPDSISFGNSTGAGISVRHGPGIESELAIFKYIPEQNHFTLTLTHRLVKNPSTNNKANFDSLEKLAKQVEEKSRLEVVFISPYATPKT